MKENIKNKVIDYFEKELSKIDVQIRHNTYELNSLVDKQKALKKCRHGITTIINSFNNKEV